MSILEFENDNFDIDIDRDVHFEEEINNEYERYQRILKSLIDYSKRLDIVTKFDNGRYKLKK